MESIIVSLILIILTLVVKDGYDKLRDIIRKARCPYEDIELKDGSHYRRIKKDLKWYQKRKSYPLDQHWIKEGDSACIVNGKPV